MPSEVLILDVTKRAIELQQEQGSAIERKASMLIAFAGATFSLLVTNWQKLALAPQTARVVLVTSLFLFAVSIVLCLCVNWVSRYRADPNPEALAQDFLDSPETQTTLQVLSNLIEVWNANTARLERKASWLKGAFGLQAIAFVLLGLALVVSLS